MRTLGFREKHGESLFHFLKPKNRRSYSTVEHFSIYTMGGAGKRMRRVGVEGAANYVKGHVNRFINQLIIAN